MPTGLDGTVVNRNRWRFDVLLSRIRISFQITPLYSDNHWGVDQVIAFFLFSKLTSSMFMIQASSINFIIAIDSSCLYNLQRQLNQ